MIGWPRASRCTRSWCVRPVRGTRSRRERLAGRVVAEHLVAGERGLAGERVDFLARPSRPVGTQRQVYFAAGRGESAGDERDIALVDLSLGELAAQAPLHLPSTSQYQEPGGVHVETMDDQGIGEFALQAPAQAVLFVLAATGHREQAGRFVDHQQGRVGVEDFWRAVRQLASADGGSVGSVGSVGRRGG
jgi:hypothetical protein